jgi:hypothetical protein
MDRALVRRSLLHIVVVVLMDTIQPTIIIIL